MNHGARTKLCASVSLNFTEGMASVQFYSNKQNVLGGAGGRDWEFGVSRCKLLYTGWLNNKVLLYTTGNDVQYPVINHNGKEYFKNKIKFKKSKKMFCLAHREFTYTNEFLISVVLL